MRSSLVLIGGAELAFGVCAAAVGVGLTAGAARRLLHLPPLVSSGSSSAPVGVVYAATCLATGWLLRSAVSSPFEALQLRNERSFTASALVSFVGYAAAHVGLALAVGLGCLMVGVFAFDRMTQGVDELEAVRRGELPPALVLSAVILVVALLASPGLDMVLQGLLPLPTLQSDAVRPLH